MIKEICSYLYDNKNAQHIDIDYLLSKKPLLILLSVETTNDSKLLFILHLSRALSCVHTFGYIIANYCPSYIIHTTRIWYKNLLGIEVVNAEDMPEITVYKRVVLHMVLQNGLHIRQPCFYNIDADKWIESEGIAFQAFRSNVFDAASRVFGGMAFLQAFEIIQYIDGASHEAHIQREELWQNTV